MVRNASSLARLALLLIGSASLSAQDRRVPSQYATLQAAVDAASPGDRILVETDLSAVGLVIRKSVSIQSDSDVWRSVSLLYDNRTQAGRIVIEALSPGIPLTFRRLRLRLSSGDGNPAGIIVTPPSSRIVGEWHMDETVVSWYGSGCCSIWSATIIRVAIDHVWLRRCAIEAADTLWNNGCFDLDTDRGSNCLEVTGNRLVLEDCYVRAGSGPHLRYSSCGGCSLQYPVGGPGGFALLADTNQTVLVRSFLSDGNGASVEANSGWCNPMYPRREGAAGRSMFTRVGGVLEAYQTEHEAGRDAAANGTRGPRILLGQPGAPLSVGGDGRLGGNVSFDLGLVSTSGATAFVALRWGYLRLPLGSTWLDPAAYVMQLPFAGPGHYTFGIPCDAFLIGMPIVSQLLYLQAPLGLGNPSGIQVRL